MDKKGVMDFYYSSNNARISASNNNLEQKGGLI